MIAKLFSDPGKKIQAFAKIVFYVGLVVSVVAGIVLTVIAFVNYWLWPSILNILFIFAAPVLAFIFWLCSLFIYAFGELVQNSTEIRKNTKQ